MGKMKKKAPKSKTQMIKDHKQEILILQEQLLASKEENESLRRHPPVLPSDRDEQGNVIPQPEPLPATKPQKGKYPLPPGRPFRVVRAGEQIALTAKALGGGAATMLFTRPLARRVGMLLCKAARPQPQEATVAEEGAEAAEQTAEETAVQE